MQENNTKNEYISGRRKHFIWIVFSLVVFGAILYFASVISDYAAENDIDNLEDAKENVVGMLKTGFAIFPENEPAEESKKSGSGKEDVSANILKVPLLLNCSFEEGKAIVKEPFEVAGSKVSGASFELANHGNTLYSLNFSSKENEVSCRGTLKEGEKKIFVYYCEKI